MISDLPLIFLGTENSLHSHIWISCETEAADDIRFVWLQLDLHICMIWVFFAYL